MIARCFDTLRGDRCRKPLGHEGFHKNGSHTWAARDIPRPVWQELGKFRRDLSERPA